MSISVLVLQERNQAEGLMSQLKEKSDPTIDYQLIRPSTVSSASSEVEGRALNIKDDSFYTEAIGIETVERLNPKLSKRKRQRNMAFWLMPFGLISGLTFNQMTGLKTFAAYGAWADPLISALLGMGSGLLGSYVASASVTSNKQDSIKRLLKRNKEGCWLLLLETPAGIELPWAIMQGIQPLEVLELSELEL